jgi:hypothetical protein
VFDGGDEWGKEFLQITGLRWVSLQYFVLTIEILMLPQYDKELDKESSS